MTDFKSYGVSIKVRFRDGEDWCELARGRQSGGEMSVTTAVYMVIISAANRSIGSTMQSVVQSRRRPLLGPSPG